MKRWISITLGALAALVLLAYLVGARLPPDHVASVRAHFHQPPDSIYRVLMDIPDYPSWRHDVERVQLSPPRGGHIVWRELTRSGTQEYEFTVAIHPTRLVSSLVSQGAGYTGRWIFQILPDAGGTNLTITEEGRVSNPFFRFVSRFILGTHTTIERYLSALGGRFGERIEPVCIL
jgi:hypothetical protein